MGRASEIEVEAEVDAAGAPTGVRVSGGAVIMMRGTIDV